MLSDRQLDAILDVFRKRMQGAMDEYLTRMGEHIRDIGMLQPSDVNRIVEMRRMNYNMEIVKRKIAQAAQSSAADIDKVFLAVAESDARFSAAVFESDHTPRVKDNPAIARVLKAQAKITKQELTNLSRTTLISTNYRNAVDVAIQTVQSGMTDYKTAIRKTLKNTATDGLRVQYPSGLTRRLDTAIRQNVLDGVRAINQDVQYQIGKEFGADGIELSAHAICAEDHLPYQGRQMTIKEFERLQNRLDRPFGMWNCRHNWHYIIMGVSEPAYTDEELRQYRDNSNELITIDGVTKTRYQWTQEQRRIETAVRYQKDIAIAAKASNDDLLRRRAQRNINDLESYYRKISKNARLKPETDRMSVSGFRKVKTADELKKRTEYGTIKLYSTMLSERKTIVKSSNSRSLSLSGEPDSIVDLLNEAGDTVLQRRVYDYSGRASADFDTDDHKRPKLHPTGAHKHIFDYSKYKPRSGYLPLTEKELAENKDIIQKGVNYHDPT